MINTVAAFAAACMTLDNDEIYELFEDDISQNLRDQIYAYSETSSAEPARSALNKIGFIFNVQSLVNY